ncbi:MAG: HalOD1 output domain-containing protein [Haloarculaceae archaeon]
MTDDAADDPTSAADGDDVQPIRYGWHQHDHPSTAVVEAVAAATGRRIDDLPPLQETVNADSLDELLTGEARGSDGELTVTFTYVGVDVVVSRDGTVAVHPDSTDDRRPPADG